MLRKALLISLIVLLPICASAQTFDQYDSGTGLLFPPGSHKFMVNGISSYTLTKWFVNNVLKQTDESKWSNGYWDPDYSMSAAPGSHYKINALLYDSSGNNHTIYTWDFYTTPYTPTTLNVRNISTSSATVYGYGMAGATNYGVQYKKSTSSAYSYNDYLPNQPSATNLSGLSSGTTYDVRVRACNSAKCSNIYERKRAFTTKSVCTYSIRPTSISNVSENGSVGDIKISGTPSGCVGSWSSSESLSWVTLTGSRNGSGSGNWTLKYNVYENTATDPRNGNIHVADKTFSINQKAIPNTAPRIPGFISAQNITTNSARVRWGASSDAQSDTITYTVQYKKDWALSWTNAGTTQRTYLDISNLEADTVYDVKITPNDGLLPGPPRNQENVITTDPNPTIAKAYWWANTSGNNDFNEGSTTTAAVKVEGVSNGTSVQFDIYENDSISYTVGSCEGDHVATVNGVVSGTVSDGYYATANWKANYFQGIFENYPNKADYCFVATMNGLQKDSSGLLKVIPDRRELEVVISEYTARGKLIITLYTKNGRDLAADKPLAITVNGHTYNVRTGQQGSLWQGLKDILSENGYYGTPGFANIENLDLTYPIQVRVAFYGDDDFNAFTKNIAIRGPEFFFSNGTVLYDELKIEIEGTVYVVSGLKTNQNDEISEWEVTDESGNCISDDKIQAKIAIYLDLLRDNGSQSDSVRSFRNLLLDKKAINIANDSEQQVALTGSITGAILAEPLGLPLVVSIASTGATTIDLISGVAVSNRGMVMANTFYEMGKSNVDLHNQIYSEILWKFNHGKVVSEDAIKQLFVTNRMAKGWFDKQSNLSSAVRTVSVSNFNFASTWVNFASNVVPGASVLTSFFSTSSNLIFVSTINELIGESAYDEIFNQVNQNLELDFSTAAIESKITELRQAGLLSGGATIFQHTVNTLSAPGGSISPEDQLVIEGTLATFVLTPQSGYSISHTLNGTCPIGHWDNNSTYTTGSITADCSIGFNFTQNSPPIYTVNSTVGTGGAVTASNQSLSGGTSAFFTVIPESGYERNDTVGGTCPAGSWNGNTYTTGSVNSNCSVAFSFTQDVTTPLSAPTLSYTISGLELSVTWESVPDAVGYKLHYAPFPYTGPESIASIDLGSSSSFDYTLWEGAAFYIAVQAYDAQQKHSDYSNIVQFVINSNTPQYNIEYQMLRHDNHHYFGERYRGYLSFTKNNLPLTPQDFSSLSVVNGRGESIPLSWISDMDTFYFITADCRAEPCTWDPPATETGISFNIDTLPLDDYTVTIDMVDERISTTISYNEDIAVPIIKAETMQAKWQGSDLILSWTNPVNQPNWNKVTRLKIGLYTTDGFAAGIYVSPTSNSVVVPSALISDIENYGEGSLYGWSIQTRAYTENASNLQNARGWSQFVNLPEKSCCGTSLSGDWTIRTTSSKYSGCTGQISTFELIHAGNNLSNDSMVMNYSTSCFSKVFGIVVSGLVNGDNVDIQASSVDSISGVDTSMTLAGKISDNQQVISGSYSWTFQNDEGSFIMTKE